MTEQQPDSASTSVSPLTEADPTSLDELFARLDSHIAARTLSLPDAQTALASVVAELRRQREAWARAEATGAKRAPKPKRTADEPATTADDLGLFDDTTADIPVVAPK